MSAARDQAIFFGAVILPQIAVLWATDFDTRPLKDVASWAGASLDSAPQWLVSPIWWAAALATTLERVTYGLVWTRADSFKKLCDGTPLLRRIGTPVDVLASFFGVFKVLQIGGLLLWFLLVTPERPDLLHMSLFRWVTGAQLVILGQVLNVAIYRAIGKAGVYYGVRLGKRVPWCDGFPFTVLQHPQYIGALMTVLGCVVLLATPAHIQAGMLGLFLYQVMTYSVTMYVEDEL